MKNIFHLNPFRLSVLVTLVGILAYGIGIPFLDLMELKTIDLRFQARGQVLANPEIVMAVIDEKSINQEGKWVWPRSKFSSLIYKLNAAGAKVIAFDIGFLEPDDQRVLETITQIQKDISRLNVDSDRLDVYLEDLKINSDEDRRLANTIRNADSRVVLGYFFQMGGVDLSHLDEATIAQHAQNVKNGTYKSVRYSSAEAQSARLIQAKMPQSNIPAISRAADYAGYFNMFPDPDGVVRWIPGVIKYGENMYAPLSLMALSAYEEQPLSVNVTELGVDSIAIGNKLIPTDELGRILINYYGPQNTVPHISITDILHDQVPADQLRDKIVFIGATAVGIYDLRVTPFGNVFPGLEIHAQTASAILDNAYLQSPAWSAIFDLIMMVLAGFVLGFILSRTGVITGGIAAIAVFGIIIAACQYLFAVQGLILNMVYPLTVALLSYTGITGFKYLSESQQKKYIRDAFSTYLAPTVVKQLIDSPESLVLGGEEREITAFFSDVQGFTSISEKLSPHDLVELLNEFLTEMTDVILEHEGTVDKFEGDAIIAFFGAPNYLDNHAEVACMACIDMQKRLSELRDKWQREGRPELKMRIGLCSGSAVVGNMGSKNRMDYTMMGDTVNTAARLEGVNKVYGIYTLISDTTRAAAGDSIVTREIDSINVVGKEVPIRVYEVLGYSGTTDVQVLEMADLYMQGLAAYRKCDWNRAIIHFNSALEIAPDDGPSKTMLLRCNNYKKAPPPNNWNGAYTMTTK